MPLEIGLSGIPHSVRLFAHTMFGLSFVVMTFDDGVDMYFARQGWYLEDLLKRPGAERGVSELLVVEALKHLAGEGAQLATLGTSPLAGDQPARRFKATAAILRLIYQHLELFYHFRALHRFKAKFAPSFIEPEYIAIYPPRIRMRQVRAVIRLFEPNGLRGLIASKWRRFLQRESQRQLAWFNANWRWAACCAIPPVVVAALSGGRAIPDGAVRRCAAFCP